MSATLSFFPFLLFVVAASKQKRRRRRRISSWKRKRRVSFPLFLHIDCNCEKKMKGIGGGRKKSPAHLLFPLGEQ